MLSLLIAKYSIRRLGLRSKIAGGQWHGSTRVHYLSYNACRALNSCCPADESMTWPREFYERAAGYILSARELVALCSPRRC